MLSRLFVKIFSRFLIDSGLPVLKLIYGIKYAEVHSKKPFLMVLLSGCNIFWLLSFLFLITGIDTSAFCMILGIGYPVAIAIWTIYARKLQTEIIGFFRRLLSFFPKAK